MVRVLALRLFVRAWKSAITISDKLPALVWNSLARLFVFFLLIKIGFLLSGGMVGFQIGGACNKDKVKIGNDCDGNLTNNVIDLLNTERQIKVKELDLERELERRRSLALKEKQEVISQETANTEFGDTPNRTESPKIRHFIRRGFSKIGGSKIIVSFMPRKHNVKNKTELHPLTRNADFGLSSSSVELVRGSKVIASPAGRIEPAPSLLKVSSKLITFSGWAMQPFLFQLGPAQEPLKVVLVTDDNKPPLHDALFWISVFGAIANTLATISTIILAWISNKRLEAELILKRAEAAQKEAEAKVKLKQMELEIMKLQQEIDKAKGFSLIIPA